MIFSSYFGNVAKLRRNGTDESRFVGISLYPCKFEHIVRYEKTIAPDLGKFWELYNGLMTWREYCLNYYEKLNNLGDDFWNQFLWNFNEKVLLCYEKDPAQSHRYLLGKYLFWKFGRCKLVEIDGDLKFWKIEKTLVKV